MYPTPTKGRKNKEVKSARVLTSAESRALLEEKERKKKEAEAKEQRKQERWTKKAEKDGEKKWKQEERAANADEQQKIAAEKAAKKLLELELGGNEELVNLLATKETPSRKAQLTKGFKDARYHQVNAQHVSDFTRMM